MEAILDKKVALVIMKDHIKNLVEEQKFLKDQRKTVHNKLERKIEPWQATMKHESNRIELSILYAALLVTRGWPIDEAAKAHISKKCEDWVFESNKEKIQKVLDSYKVKEE